MHVLRFILSIMQFINKILQREMCEKSRDMKATWIKYSVEKPNSYMSQKRHFNEVDYKMQNTI